MDRPTGREAYRAAREMLLRHSDDYDTAVADLRWPDVGRTATSHPTNPSGGSNS